MALEAFELGLAKLGMTGCKRDNRARCQGAILVLMRLNFVCVRFDILVWRLEQSGLKWKDGE